MEIPIGNLLELLGISLDEGNLSSFSKYIFSCKLGTELK